MAGEKSVFHLWNIFQGFNLTYDVDNDVESKWFTMTQGVQLIS